MVARGTVPAKKAVAPVFGPCVSWPRMIGALTVSENTTFGTSAIVSDTVASPVFSLSISRLVLIDTEDAVLFRSRETFSPVTTIGLRTVASPASCAS